MTLSPEAAAVLDRCPFPDTEGAAAVKVRALLWAARNEKDPAEAGPLTQPHTPPTDQAELAARS